VDLNFLIATVPNPIETHLALWFDRAVESIINAAGSVGFRFQEAWLPWKADLVREESDIFKRNEMEAELRRREKEPGVLLFRNSDPCTKTLQRCQYSDLVVLLVPETPTGGIDPDVFADATKMIFSASSFLNGAGGASLAATPTIPVMGPSFSGSFPSLGKIMQQHREIKLQVISGSAASRDAWRGAFDGESGSSYRTTVQNLDTQLDMLRQTICEWKNGSRLALLTETETHLFPSDDVHLPPPEVLCGDGPVIFRYPREISRLRNAYGDEVLKTVVGAQPQPPSFRNLLGFRLFDVGPGTDSAPVFAKNQTPLSQDAVLGEIARSLERERVTLAGILATDVFDALFIARYLRDACPDVRLFTFDSDLLYERAAEEFPFDGTLALATYPSIAPNQAWTNEGPERFSFPSRASEGIYNATRALLILAAFVSEDYKSKPLVEYFNPTLSTTPTGSYVPPVWLTVVGRSGYWPLAVMNAQPDVTQTSCSTPKNGLLLAWPLSDNVPQFGLGPLPRLWQLIFVVIALVLGLYLVRNFMACATGYGGMRGFSHLNVWPDEEGWLARLCYLLVCSYALLALYALLVVPLISIRRALPPDARWYVWIAALLLFVFAVLGASPLLAFRKRKPARLVWPETWHFGILGTAAMLAGFFTWCLLRLLPLDPGKKFKNQEAFFFAFRSLHLTSGVSPVMPLLVLLPAYFLWGRVHLTRVQRIHERLIDVPLLEDNSICHGGEALALDDCRKEIDLLVKQALPLRWWRTVGALAFVLAIDFYMTHPLRSFEYEPFDKLFLVMLSVLYALMFLTWTRFVMVWQQFQVFLEQLERQPLRFAFDKLPQRRAISPLFQYRAWHAEFTTFVAIRERLAELMTRPASVDSASLYLGAADKLDGEISQILTSVTRERRISREDAAPLRQWLGQVNDALLEELRRGLWKSGRTARSADKPKLKKGPEPDQPVATSPDILREEIIALQYDDYIQYVLHQQRNLLLFAVLSFILSILALHAYPFEGPRMITTFITFVFIAFAGGVIVVLAQADRNPILSRITKTTPGKLSGGFFLKVAGYIGVPLITVLSSQFPSLGHFLFSWVQPLLDAVK
jgi:hypothetical protein